MVPPWGHIIYIYIYIRWATRPHSFDMRTCAVFLVWESSIWLRVPRGPTYALQSRAVRSSLSAHLVAVKLLSGSLFLTGGLASISQGCRRGSSQVQRRRETVLAHNNRHVALTALCAVNASAPCILTRNCTKYKDLKSIKSSKNQSNIYIYICIYIY